MGPNGDLGPNLGQKRANLSFSGRSKELIWSILGFSRWSKRLIWGKTGLSKPESGPFWAKKSKKFSPLECKTLRLWVLALKWGQLGTFLPKPGKISNICLKKA